MSAPPGELRREERLGLLAASGAYALWGLLPLYLKLLEHVDAREVLGQRILWCAPAALIALLAMNGLSNAVGELRAALRPRMLGVLCLTALLIFINWAVYVWLVLQARIIEASLAYFLAPLVSVCIGVVFFRESTTRAQIGALALAAAGVVLQGAALGAPPWMALILCATWSGYAALRKLAPVSSATGLFVETVALAPLAAGMLLWVAHDGLLSFNESPDVAALLVIAGPVTALPLVLFTIGARRVSFTALGLMQYFAPTLQFLIGIAFGESFSPLRGASFALIWLGLAVFTWDRLRHARTTATA